MIKTLYFRVVLTFLCVIIFSLVSAFYIGYGLFKQEVHVLGQNDMFEIGEEIISLYQETKPVDQDAFIKSMVSVSAHPIHMFDANGDVRSYQLEKTEPLDIAPDVLYSVLGGESYRSPGKGEPTFIGIPFPIAGETYAMFMQFSSQNENVINQMMFSVLVLGLLIGSVCILVAARYLVKPLQVLTQATKKVKKGDFDVRINTKRVDEVGTLTKSFNEMASELKQVEQMRQEFVSNVSHEIQTPLTSISGFATAMKVNNLIAESDRDYYLDVIIAESNRLSRLSDNLLKLASLDSEHHPFETATYNLDEQVREVVVACEPQWTAKSIQLELNLPDNVQIIGDRDLLSQVWMNLLGNAIKFTPTGGVITLSIDRVEMNVVFTITDTGKGIAKEKILFVFDRFFKSDSSRNRNVDGNGLGLAIAKKIVAIHSGEIEITSQPDIGTTVIVKLPTGNAT